VGLVPTFAAGVAHVWAGASALRMPEAMALEAPNAFWATDPEAAVRPTNPDATDLCGFRRSRYSDLGNLLTIGEPNAKTRPFMSLGFSCHCGIGIYSFVVAKI